MINSIPYTYKIVRVDEAARCMEIVYTSPGRQPVLVGARLPYAGESVETVVKMYSPVPRWQLEDLEVQIPNVGMVGDVGIESFSKPTLKQFLETLSNEVQQHLDEFAWSRGYNNILSACSYVTSSVPAYVKDAEYAIQARDVTWAAATIIFNKIKSGELVIEDTSAPFDIISQLPALAWPV